MGLSVADLQEATVQALRRLFPEWMLVSNPIDIWPAVEKNVKTKVNVLKESLRVLLTDRAVDAVLLVFWATLGPPSTGRFRRRDAARGKTRLLLFYGKSRVDLPLPGRSQISQSARLSGSILCCRVHGRGL